MRTWNYRVIASSDNDETTYAVHEVYYSEDGDIVSWTEEPVPAVSESVDGLREVLARYQRAASMPVLRQVANRLLDEAESRYS